MVLVGVSRHLVKMNKLYMNINDYYRIREYLFNIKYKSNFGTKATYIAVHSTNSNNSTRLLTKAIYCRVTIAKMFDTTKM